jgi:shikimate 5-dehydrogenase
MVIHFRDSLDAIGAAQSMLARTTLARALDPVYAFLSVTEAGLYHISAELAREAEARGCVTPDGLGMLVNQATIGIKHWTGVDV